MDTRQAAPTGNRQPVPVRRSVDVVTSRQRCYQHRVVCLVGQWQADDEQHSLRWLSMHEPASERYGPRSGESQTIAIIARNLPVPSPMILYLTKTTRKE